MPKEAFDAAIPVEFWREVVDRVAAEVPDTLLLAEAFWLMEATSSGRSACTASTTAPS